MRILVVSALALALSLIVAPRPAACGCNGLPCITTCVQGCACIDGTCIGH